MSGLVARRARPEGVEPPAGGFGDRGATMARAQEDEGVGAQDVVRVSQRLAVGAQTQMAELPADAGPTAIGRFPTSRPLLMIERLAG